MATSQVVQTVLSSIRLPGLDVRDFVQSQAKGQIEPGG